LRGGGQALSGAVDGAVVRCALDRPHASFIFATVVCGPKGGGAPGAAVGSSGWVAKGELLVATALTSSYAYEAASGDEASFGAGEGVFGFLEQDGWWDGFTASNGQHKCGTFPGNYVTPASPQPAFAAAASAVPAPPAYSAPRPAAAYTAAGAPGTSNPLGGGGGQGQDPEAQLVAPTVKAPAPAAPRGGGGGGDSGRSFKGEKPLQYAVWGHSMAYGCAFECFWCGQFTVLWADGYGWDCKVNRADGLEGMQLIHPSLVVNASLVGCDPASLKAAKNRDRSCCPREACCDPNAFKDVDLHGSGLFGGICLGLAFLIVLLEHEDWGFGLWQPADWVFYKKQVSPLGVFYGLAALPCFLAYPSAFAGCCLLATACVHQRSYQRSESGDGGRSARKAMAARKATELAKKAEAAAAKGLAPPPSKGLADYPMDWYKGLSLTDAVLHPLAFLRKLSTEDRLSSAFWLSLYAAVNVFIFFFVLEIFEHAIDDMEVRRCLEHLQAWRGGHSHLFPFPLYASRFNPPPLCAMPQATMLDGTIDTDCFGRGKRGAACSANRSVVRHGFLSRAGPWAKACGGCLNFNCALIVMPVTKLLLARLNNLGNSAGTHLAGKSVVSQCFARWFAHPFTRYVPLSKNVEFHKIIGKTVLGFGVLHTLCHFANYWESSVGTLAYFTKWGWSGTAFFTGFAICLAMFFIYTAATPAVKVKKHTHK
jgi:hypothetical protein